MNLCGGEGSHVAWHSDNEDLLGPREESKLDVSLSLGSFAEFKWKPQSWSSGQAGSGSEMIVKSMWSAMVWTRRHKDDCGVDDTENTTLRGRGRRGGKIRKQCV